MQFAKPQFLWLLLLIPPAMACFLWWAERKRESLMTRFIHARLLPGLISGYSSARRRWRWAAILGAVCLLILALARPQWGATWEEVSQKGLDIVVAVDVSRSMLAGDIAPNRLARAKLAALDLMQLARSDRLGLVAFAGDAFLQCPLTIDDSVFRQTVDSLNPRVMSQGGTALAQAIDAAASAFKEGDNYKALVILSDGEDHDSNALEAAKRAAAAGLQIFTVGIGSTEGEVLRVKDDTGKEDYVRDEQGNAVKSRLNEALLQEIAGVSERGFYLRLGGGKTMDTLYEKGLAPMPKSEASEKFVKRYRERYHWPLGLALLLLAAEPFIPLRRGRKPSETPARREPSSRQRGEKAAGPVSRAPLQAPTSAALLLVCVLAATPAFASSSRALRDYNSGKFDRSLQEYKELLQRKGSDPRLHFNAGAAAYRDGQFNEAASQFDQALSDQDLDLQGKAYYNRGNANFRLGEQTPDPQARTALWEKALRDYQASLKLNSRDPDAQFNHEFVKRKLEELKQQPQQQQDQGDQKNPDQKQDESQQQQQSGNQKDPTQKDEQQQGQSADQPKEQQPQPSKQPAKPQNGKDREQPENGKDKQQKKDAKEAQKKASEQQQKKPADRAPSDSKEDSEAENIPGQLTPEQARQMLDAQKGDEKVLQYQNQKRPADARKPARDW